MDGARELVREEVIRDGIISGRKSHARVGLLPVNGAVGLCRIPPIRQKDGEWMGHGSCLREEVIRDGFISGRDSHARVGLLLMNGLAARSSARSRLLFSKTRRQAQYP
jgi:hypothetical protein